MLKRHGAGATFLFSLGPDHTGRAIKRVFRPGFMQKVRRTSVVSHYGIRRCSTARCCPARTSAGAAATSCAGCATKASRSASTTWDHVSGRTGWRRRCAHWTGAQMKRACERFTRDLRSRPAGARRRRLADERARLRLTQMLGFGYCSDTRGTHPFISRVPGRDRGVPAVADHAAHAGRDDRPRRRDRGERRRAAARAQRRDRRCRCGHVFTLHAELEGMKLAPGVRAAPRGVEGAGLHADVDAATTSSAAPARPCRATRPGRRRFRAARGTLALQGPAFLADRPRACRVPIAGIRH